MPTEDDFRPVPQGSVEERRCPTCRNWRLSYGSSSKMVCERCRERERICSLLQGERESLIAREDHDGGPPLHHLIDELIEKIRKVRP